MIFRLLDTIHLILHTNLSDTLFLPLLCIFLCVCVFIFGHIQGWRSCPETSQKCLTTMFLSSMLTSYPRRRYRTVPYRIVLHCCALCLDVFVIIVFDAPGYAHTRPNTGFSLPTSNLFNYGIIQFDPVSCPSTSDRLYLTQRLYETLGVPHDPLTLIPPQFECPMPKLSPATFPPAMREPAPPALDQFDLDEHFAKEGEHFIAHGGHE